MIKKNKPFFNAYFKTKNSSTNVWINTKDFLSRQMLISLLNNPAEKKLSWFYNNCIESGLMKVNWKENSLLEGLFKQ